jgi:hypothetical protein
MGLRDKLRRLERASREELIAIPQQDGTVARFPKSAYKEAFLNAINRLGAGEEAPPRHPLLVAAANSSDPRWRTSFFSDIDFDGAVEQIEDLSDSEGAW